MLNEKKFNPSQEEMLFRKRSRFVLDNYPFDESRLSPQKIINSALDGFRVIEDKSEKGEIESMISFDVNTDNNHKKYGEIGLMITKEEPRNEGRMKELFEKLKENLVAQGCEYLTAKADTSDGGGMLTSFGFYVDEDPVNGKEYYRFDL